ncbi:MAG: PD40 domain-containing protein [Thermoanaerobaculia bacterium]|nr:PD40 domain-containing protein [Thermoanaerobaculia bacterium]
MTLTTGARLGPYEILAPLGAGGMGEVYRARDSKLGREVAVKVLPDEFLADRERLARFDREAHLLASLNHANVAAIYGFEEARGMRFLVLELVLGETLAERFARGPLELDDALPLFRQIAEALESAHEKGIVHRDLKPANVKVTPAGKVKVLDFGLGKVFEKEGVSSDVSRSPTITHGATHQGVILGTAAYMSPEQARGKPVDKRTDIWSFGCVLFEALAGRRAFAGDTTSDVMAAVLTREPDWSGLPAATPPRLRDLLRRCLQKDTQRRLHDIADARLEIEEVVGEPSAPGAEAVTAPRRKPGWGVGAMAAAALGFALLGALLTWTLLRSARVDEGAMPRVGSVARLTHDPGSSEWPTWSPDGSLLAFASSRDGNFEILVRRVQGGQEVNITQDTGDDFQPAFSPDGNSIAFVSTRSSRTGMIKIGATFGFEFRTYGGDLWVAPSLGGRARRLAADGNFPTWNPDGRRIAYVSGGEDHRSILEVSAEGGRPKEILSTGSSSWEILRLQHSPGGRWLSFETADGVYVLPLSGGAPRKLIAATSHVWDPAGERLYFLNREPGGGTRLQTVAISAQTGEVRSAPQTVGLTTGILRDLAVSRDGKELAVAELEASLNLTRIPLTPDGGGPAGPEEELSSGRVHDRYPTISPDGGRIAFASDRLGPMEVWILNLKNRHQERLQLPGEDSGASFAYWLPDGKRLVITRFFPDGTRSLWLAYADGSHAEELRSRARSLQGARVSPDGAEVAYGRHADGFLQLFSVNLETRKERQLTASRSYKYELDWSPDSRFFVYTSNEGGAMRLWKMPAAGGRAEPLTTGFERMRHSFYSPDGRWIYVQSSHRNIHRLPAEGGSLQPVTRFPESGLFLEEPTLSPDGRYLAYCRSNGGSSLWLLTLEHPGEPEKAK